MFYCISICISHRTDWRSLFITVKGTRGVASVLVAFFNGLWYLLAAALVIAICVTAAGWPLARLLARFPFEHPEGAHCHFLWRQAAVGSVTRTHASANEDTHYLYPCLGPLATVDGPAEAMQKLHERLMATAEGVAVQL
jgi:hypothetical protein